MAADSNHIPVGEYTGKPRWFAGLRRLMLCVFSILVAGILCAVGKVTGAEFVQVVTGCVIAFAAPDGIEKFRKPGGGITTPADQPSSPPASDPAKA